jgi:hypothetical protein
LKKKVINIVLKSEMDQFFWDNIFLQMAKLLCEGGSNLEVLFREKVIQPTTVSSSIYPKRVEKLYGNIKEMDKK